MTDEAAGAEGNPEETPSLGEELRLVREARSLTLRAVERLTGVSNAYLSQLETGKIEKPAPHFLHKLAEAYGVPYELLMERAGYIKRGAAKGEQRPPSLAGAALAAVDDLTAQEAKELVRYLAFLRSRSRTERRRG